jgi:hypothetical protein
MAICEKEIKTAYIRETGGVEQVLLPGNIRYMVVETGGVLGKIRSFGRRRPAAVYRFPLPAFTDSDRPYYIDAINDNTGERIHLEVKAKAKKIGTKAGAEGQVSDVYKVSVGKVLDADSRLGFLRRKKRVLEATEENMKELQEFNFAPI